VEHDFRLGVETAEKRRVLASLHLETRDGDDEAEQRPANARSNVVCEAWSSRRAGAPSSTRADIRWAAPGARPAPGI
jgi:hypothetical protein